MQARSARTRALLVARILGTSLRSDPRKSGSAPLGALYPLPPRAAAKQKARRVCSIVLGFACGPFSSAAGGLRSGGFRGVVCPGRARAPLGPWGGRGWGWSGPFRAGRLVAGAWLPNPLWCGLVFGPSLVRGVVAGSSLRRCLWVSTQPVFLNSPAAGVPPGGLGRPPRACSAGPPPFALGWFRRAASVGLAPLGRPARPARGVGFCRVGWGWLPLGGRAPRVRLPPDRTRAWSA